MLVACASGPLPPDFDPKWVTITVVDASQRPVVGAEVSGPGASSLTDARGQVRLPYEEHDTFHEFGVAAAGFVSIVHPTADWHYGRDQLVELQPDEPIRVRVLEAGTDRPLGGVRVGGRWSKVSATTDDDGCVEVRGMKPLRGSTPDLQLFRWREDYFQWGHEKYSGGPRKLPVVRENDTYVVRLRPVPLKEFVLRAAPGRTFTETTRIEADDEEVPNVVVEAGGQQLRCRLAPSMIPLVRVPGHEEYVAWSKTDAEEPIVVDLHAGVRCSGRVLGPDGPIAGARVTLHWGETHPSPWRVVRTGDDGSWSASDCPRNVDIWMGVSAASHLTTGMPVPALAERAPATTEDVALGDVQLEREQLAVARLDPMWCGQSVQLWTTVTDGPAITGVHWSRLDGTVVIRGLERGVHRLKWPGWKWPEVKDDYYRDFVIDGSRTVVDVGALPLVGPLSR